MTQRTVVLYTLAWCGLSLCLVLSAGELNSRDKGVDGQDQSSREIEGTALEWQNALQKELKRLGEKYSIDYDEEEYSIDYDEDGLGVSIRKDGKTKEKYGFFHWDERQIGRLELVKIRDNDAIVVKSEVRVEIKAPLFGNWRVEDRNVTSVMPLPPVGKLVKSVTGGSP